MLGRALLPFHEKIANAGWEGRNCAALSAHTCCLGLLSRFPTPFAERFRLRESARRSSLASPSLTLSTTSTGGAMPARLSQTTRRYWRPVQPTATRRVPRSTPCRQPIYNDYVHIAGLQVPRAVSHTTRAGARRAPYATMQN